MCPGGRAGCTGGSAYSRAVGGVRTLGGGGGGEEGVNVSITEGYRDAIREKVVALVVRRGIGIVCISIYCTSFNAGFYRHGIKITERDTHVRLRYSNC